MNKDKYNKLCKVCDKILLDHLTATRVSISWLHVLQWHPGVLDQYKYLFVSDLIKKRAYAFYLLIRYRLITIIRVISGIWHHKYYYRSVNKLDESDVLFISHLTNKNITCTQDDFYFGTIPRELKNIGITTTIALINHIGVRSIAKCNWGYDDIVRVVFTKNISFINEIKIFLAQRKESTGLLTSSLLNDEFYNEVLKEASVHAYSSSTANNLRIAKQFSQLLKSINPRYVIFTYEGHAWERLIISQAKKFNCNIKCIGYQHSFVNDWSYAIYRKLGNNFDPDVIMSSGQMNLSYLNKYTDSDIKKIYIGSSKKIGSYKHCHYNMGNKITCLVLPDNFMSECEKILLFACLLANIFSEVRFIFRLHPNTSKEKLQKKYPQLKTIKTNIVWSNQSLKNDFEKSDIALYRGTTAIFEAPYFNVMPVFVGNNLDIMMDPLSGLCGIRPEISEIDDFNLIIEVNNSCKRNDMMLAISKYCDMQFGIVDIKSLSQIISPNYSVYQ